MLLDGKVAVITGSASGIGRAAAILFAREGAKVVVSDISDQAGQEVVKTIKDASNEAIYCHANAGIMTDLEKLVKTAVDTYGRLDIYWHNSGVVPPGTIEETTEEDFDRQITMHVKSGFFGAKFAIPEIVKSGGGSILFTSSIAGLKPSPFSPSYSVSKVGLVMLSRSLAVALAKQNIRVNCVCPGATITGLMQEQWDVDPSKKEAIDQLVEMSPMGRYMTVDEMAETALFLVSDKASGITGLSIPVDGGRSAG